MKYTHRYLAKIVLEADCPFNISTGRDNLETQSPAIRDINGLPYLPSSSIAGVLRHAIGEEAASTFFGSLETDAGSRIIFTDGVMIGKNGTALDGIKDIDFNDSFYRHFNKLPIRHHVRINEKGAGADKGKYDHEIVYKGTRFVFEIIMYSDGTDQQQFEEVLEKLRDSNFALGGKTRRGLGRMKVVKCAKAILDLKKKEDLSDYLNKSASLEEPFSRYEDVTTEPTNPTGWTKYEMTLIPDDYFLFRAGESDDNRNAIPTTEAYIRWDVNQKPSFVEGCVILPGSSIKGAIAHRTAYHWNRINQNYAERPLHIVGDKNPAVRTIFGYVDGDNARRGNCLIPDIIEELPLNNRDKKIFNHVAIDRVTGGASQTALFSEQAVYRKGMVYSLNILVKDDVLTDNTICEAFECALKDISNGNLPLGGLTSRGYGIFSGAIKKNGEVII